MGLREILPYFLKKRLFGDRDKFGLIPDETDSMWKKWKDVNMDCREAHQKKGVGGIVNHSGYKALSNIDLTGLNVLEIGPGDIRHIPYWKDGSKPKSYMIADIWPEMIRRSSEILSKNKINYNTVCLGRDSSRLPFEDSSFDCIVTFFSLEHIYPLTDYLNELKRVLKTGGVVIGAIPAEGGISWGLGRFLTSRRWLKKNGVDMDQIICWEHPNFADYIIESLNDRFVKKSLSFWPMKIHLYDVNLVVKFVYEKE